MWQAWHLTFYFLKSFISWIVFVPVDSHLVQKCVWHHLEKWILLQTLKDKKGGVHLYSVEISVFVIFLYDGTTG